MVRVLGIKIYDRDLGSACKKIITECSKPKKNRCIGATGAHGLVTAKEDPSFSKILDKFYLNLPDGQPAVWIGRIKGAKKMRRCYGPDLLKLIMLNSSNKKIKHFLCGGKPGIARELKMICKRRFNNKNVLGTYCPPFRELKAAEFLSLAKKISKQKINIVWVGLGTPKQEIFALKLSELTNVNFIITVGAAFDFHTGRIKQAPAIIQKIGLEWLFRLATEPRRLWRRYFKVVPLFIWFNIREMLTLNK